MKKLALCIVVLFVGACTAHRPEVKTAESQPEACGYPKGCYCQPVGDGSTGLLVNRDGHASLGPVMCISDAEDLSRHDSFCLPVVGESRGIKVVDGRVQIQGAGHTHDVEASGPIWCEVQ